MLELLHVSNLLLLERLQTACVNHLISLSSESIKSHASILRASWSMNLPRLEQFATKFYAENFEDVVDEGEFRCLIQESAESVKNREEEDTIIFVDDLRWWLGRVHGFKGGDDVGVTGKNAEIVVRVGENVETRRDAFLRQLDMLDSILEELDLFVVG
ncbi:hypothetical protein HDU98_000116 [Podochytrium sp. JEL0797]|nr:hypothetical protein HDU98_000116 [Podochytrium sp. JEL0797]